MSDINLNPNRSEVDQPIAKAKYRTHWLTWFFSAVVLIPTILGFANKFLDLVLVVQGDEEGAFAVTPIVNYLFATAGFLCLLLWTAAQGAFQDLDGPSQTMFENEQRFDDKL